MYVDDIICTVRGDPDKYLKFANSLQNNLQLTLENVNMEGNLPFLDINVNVSSKIISPVIGIKNQLTLE